VSLLMLALSMLGAVLLTQVQFETKAIGAAWILAYAFLAWKVWKRRSETAPVVTISDYGVFDRRLSAAPLPWNAISRVEGMEVEHVFFVGLNFYDARAALKAARPIVRRMAPAHRLLGFPDVSISVSLLERSDADLVAAIASFRPELAATDG
jgi:hypothetical protein